METELVLAMRGLCPTLRTLFAVLSILAVIMWLASYVASVRLKYNKDWKDRLRLLSVLFGILAVICIVAYFLVPIIISIFTGYPLDQIMCEGSAVYHPPTESNCSGIWEGEGCVAFVD